ncbi:hypothetical protein BVC93_31765 (plasmid) [Mycobacterium sp. MS1601]|uniref:hypothetical protein n=1 Tax=Mycobacterium sp. MS1601 TaxID=1936029 RepID=UPI0009796E37|nr:hypothetical protein [Mycobacterium sp. MS1601]AQA07069.1 hypothetical protein BVC93_31765 [Mycobacterium sp. MS1601]
MSVIEPDHRFEHGVEAAPKGLLGARAFVQDARVEVGGDRGGARRGVGRVVRGVFQCRAAHQVVVPDEGQQALGDGLEFEVGFGVDNGEKCFGGCELCGDFAGGRFPLERALVDGERDRVDPRQRGDLGDAPVPGQGLFDVVRGALEIDVVQ